MTRPHTSRRRAAAGLLACLASAFVAMPAAAQGFPSKPVRITTPFPVGSGPEGVLRLLAEKLAVQWKQPVIVENKPGGNGFIAIQQFKRGAPDGHELIQLDTSQLTAYPSLFRKLPYDVDKDFEPLLPLFRNPFMVAVAADSPYRTVADLLKDAAARPGKVTYGSWSIGNPVHLGSAAIETATNLRMTHVPYKETTQLYAAVSTQEIDWALGSVGSTLNLYKAGKLRYIATTATARMPEFPNVPTVAESGGPAGYEMSAWTALVAPKGLPPAIADKIAADVARALAEPDIREKFVAFGYEPWTVSPEGFRKAVAEQSKRFGTVLRTLQISLD